MPELTNPRHDRNVRMTAPNRATHLVATINTWNQIAITFRSVVLYDVSSSWLEGRCFNPNPRGNTKSF
jgi:hypothetical protein